MKVVFTGGGTAGHIFPGIAVIEQLEKISTQSNRQIQPVWIGSKKESDREIVETSNVPFYSIPAGKLRRYFSLRNVSDLFKIFAGFVKSIHLLRKLKPDMLFSKGGFVAVPPCMAARMLRIPVFIHECDFSPGLATRLTAKHAKKIFVSYADTIQMFAPGLRDRCVVTGNPVRERFYTANAENGKVFLSATGTEKRIMLVIGGSSGAKQINDLIFDNAEFLCKNFFVIHQLGAANIDRGEKIKNKLHTIDPQLAESYKPFDFIGKQMPDVLAASDLVISRAGANSVWEIICEAKPSILIPLSTGSSRGDQIENAKYFEKLGCTKVLLNEQVTSENFLATIKMLIENASELQAMSQAAKQISQAPAAEQIAFELYSYIQKE